MARTRRHGFTAAQQEICEAALLARHTASEAAFAAKMTLGQVDHVRADMVRRGIELPASIRNNRHARRFELSVLIQGSLAGVPADLSEGGNS